MSTTTEKMKIMQAYLDGKSIAWNNGTANGIHRKIDGGNPIWNWGQANYEIVVEPISMQRYINMMKDGDIGGIYLSKTAANEHAGSWTARKAVPVCITECME